MENKMPYTTRYEPYADTWYSLLSDGQIQMLKEIEKPLGRCPGWVISTINSIPPEDRQTFYGDCTWGQWQGDLVMNMAYRLRPDWVRPKKEEPKNPSSTVVQVGGHCLVVCDVYQSGHHWEYKHDHMHTGSFPVFRLSEAPGRVGFFGIEYKEDPGQFYRGSVMVRRSFGDVVWWDYNLKLESLSDLAIPTPVRVAFQENKR